MIDKNLEIRQAYGALLSNILLGTKKVEVFYQFVPKGAPPMYILIQSMNSIGIETKQDQLREMSIQILIHTRLDFNGGGEADKIANEVMEALYPNRQFVIPHTKSTRLISDNTLSDYDHNAKKQIIERILTFNHIY